MYAFPLIQFGCPVNKNKLTFRKFISMLSRLMIIMLAGIPAFVYGQYKNDDVFYKTVDVAEFCAMLDKHKEHLLLDVRSKGENSDTSTFTGLNIGHLKGAKNIDVRELGNRLAEISAYKDQPIFVYCSHSQRSRRASKMLADSGFKRVYNVNGGLTALYGFQDCIPQLIASGNKYEIISPKEVCHRINAGKNFFLLDVRADSAFRGISPDARTNAQGYLKGSINIPVNELGMKLSLVPRDKQIIVTDLYGGDAGKAAALLTQNGYTNVAVLIEGINRWLGTDEQELTCKYEAYVSPVKYRILSSKEFGRFMQHKKEHLLLDVRTADEFANKSKDSWRNIGQLMNAINIPGAELGTRINELESYRDKEIIIYAFGSGPEAFEAARMLADYGFKKTHVLISGLHNIRWLAANDKTQASLKTWVVNVPEINW